MPRPRKNRCIKFNPDITYFKPRGIPLREIGEVVLAPDELEALRLADVKDYDQIEAARLMKISQSTFQRILTLAHRKIAEALIEGKAIRIQKPHQS